MSFLQKLQKTIMQEKKLPQKNIYFLVPESDIQVGEKPLDLIPEEENTFILVPAEDETGQEEPCLIVSVEPSEEEETVPLSLSEQNKKETPKEQTVPPISSKWKRWTWAQEFLEEEESAVLFSTGAGGQMKHALSVPVEPTEEEEAVILSETKEHQAVSQSDVDENPELDPAADEDEESVALLSTEREGQVEPAAEET